MEEKRRIVKVIGGEVTEKGHTTLDMIDDILDEYNFIEQLEEIYGEGFEEEIEEGGKAARDARKAELRKEFDKRAAMLQ